MFSRMPFKQDVLNCVLVTSGKLYTFTLASLTLTHFQGHWRALKENACATILFCMQVAWAFPLLVCHQSGVTDMGCSRVLLGTKGFVQNWNTNTKICICCHTEVFHILTFGRPYHMSKKRKKGVVGYGYYNEILLMNLLIYLHMCICSIQFARGVLRHTVQTELRVL